MYLKKKPKNITEEPTSDSNSPQQQQLALDLDNLAPVIKEKTISAKHLQSQEADSNRPILGKKRSISKPEINSESSPTNSEEIDRTIAEISALESIAPEIKAIPTIQEKRINPINEIITELANDLKHESLTRFAAGTDFEVENFSYSQDYSAFLASYE